MDASIDAPIGFLPIVVSASGLEIVTDIGVVGTASFDVTNNNAVTVMVGALVTGAPRFDVSSSCGGGLPAGSTCQVYVHFLPYTKGQRTATVSLTVNGAAAQDVSILGDTYTKLTATPMWGRGTITAAPPLTACNGECTGKFRGDVTLTAAAAPGQVFVGWSEPSCGAASTCLIKAEELGRDVSASFAPQTSAVLNVVVAGTHTTVNVYDPSNAGSSDRFVATCTANCTVPIPAGAPVDVQVTSAWGATALTGACSGEASCTFTSGAGAHAITATTTVDARERWVRTFDANRPWRAGAFDADGNLIITSDDGIWTAKLDSEGRTLWANPTQGQEVRLGPNGTIYLRMAFGWRRRDRDGYLLDANSWQSLATFEPIDPYYPRRLTISSVGSASGVSAKNGVTNVESINSNPYLLWMRVVARESLQSVALGPNDDIYVAVRNAAGGADALRFTAAGVASSPIVGIAPHGNVVMEIAPNGDVVTASASESEVSLRRVTSAGAIVYERNVARANTPALHTGVVLLSNGSAFWLYPAVSPFSGTTGGRGFEIDLLGTTGALQWTLNRPSKANDVIGHGHEVLDLTSNGTDVALVGIARAGGSSTPLHDGLGWVAVMRP